jgi:class 3 adenylate cyclase
VLLLFTDIEGSTDHLPMLQSAYGRLLADRSRLLRDACAGHGGHEIDTQSDAFFYVFQHANDAVRAAVELQRATAQHEWPTGATLRVRVGVHTGEPELTDRRYVGLDVHRAARICSAAHGGQVLPSQSSATMVGDDLPSGVVLKELGSVNLKGFDKPELVAQLEIDDLPTSFPALRTAEALDDGSTAAIADAGPDVEGLEFELLLLGPMAARRAQREVTITAAKHRVILATLGLRVGEVVSTDILIDTPGAITRPPRRRRRCRSISASWAN